MGEIIFLVLGIVTSTALFWQTFHFRVSILDKSGGAAMFPRIVLVALIFFMALRILTILKGKKKERFIFSEIFQGSRLIFFVVLASMVLLMHSVGYLITTSLFMFIILLCFRYDTDGTVGTVRQISLTALLVVAFVVPMYLFFAKFLKVYLPVGIFGF